ncbi:hypothetical protein Pint_11015 [Pistacia integerrima]|uniref:Uncharacterized protein n=1 Tax=Pistacia integerrima TaxID=434235 RepID=A0ACC0XJQ5_9ROSI|nr:hypothetical protein Pint_11015 [Pistacia integerrima]
MCLSLWKLFTRMPMFCFYFVWLNENGEGNDDSFACSSCCVFGGEPLHIMMIAVA